MLNVAEVFELDAENKSVASIDRSGKISTCRIFGATRAVHL